MYIQPIETWYADTFFRSRLEARWAVYFDALSIPWEYEPEHYGLSSGGSYVPDFSLCHGKLLAEIKPRGGSFEKAVALDHVVLLLEDVPEEPAIYRDNKGWHVYVGHQLYRYQRQVDLDLEVGSLPNPITIRAIQLARSERFGAHAPRNRHLLTVSERIKKFGVQSPMEVEHLCELCVSRVDLDAVGDYIFERRWCGGLCTACGGGRGNCFITCGHADNCEYREAYERIDPVKFALRKRRCDSGCLTPEGTYRARGTWAGFIDDELCSVSFADGEKFVVSLEIREVLEDGNGAEVGETFEYVEPISSALATLRLLGWKGDDPSDLSGIDKTEVRVRVEHEKRQDGQFFEKITLGQDGSRARGEHRA